MLQHSQIALRNGSLHLVEDGTVGNPALLFLHGWPESWRAFENVMALASQALPCSCSRLARHRWIASGKCSRNQAAYRRIHPRACRKKHPQSLTLVGHDVVVRSPTPAYGAPSALSAGFGWYRAFTQDAKDNRDTLSEVKETALLYLRGDRERGNIEEYVAGFRDAGIKNVQSEVIKDCGHFAPEEQPEEVWRVIKAFLEHTC